MKRKRARSGMEPLGAVLEQAGGVVAPKTAPRTPVAPRDWEAAVGSRIAMRAQPVKLERGLLVVRAASATWAQELSLLAEPILAQLRARGVAVTELRFRVGPVEPPERAKTREEVRTSPPPAPLPPTLADDIRRVEDEGLREAIARAASKNLGWQRMRAAKAKQASNRTNPAPTNPPPTNPTNPTNPPEPATTKRAAPGPRPAAPETDPPARAEARASASRPRTRGST